MNKITFLKFLDGIIGAPLVSVLSKSKSSGKEIPKSIERLLVIRPGGIGDAVLLLPAIRSFKKHFPDCRIDILCERRNADVFRLSGHVNHIYLYDRGTDFLKCVSGKKYDAVIDTEQWHKLSAVAAALTRAGIRIGFGTNERRKLFTHGIPYSHEDYEVYSFSHLMEPLIGKIQDFNVNEPFIDVAEGTCRYLPCEMKETNDGFIAISPGASTAERRWGGTRFGETARALAGDGYGIIIIGSRLDRHDAEIIRKHVPESMDLTGATTLKDVAALLKKCKLLITADSGIMHLSYAVGTPTLSIFGSGIEQKWAPRGGKHRVLNERLECSPCTKFGNTPACRKDVECLSLISVEEVLRSVREILGRVK